MKDHKDDLRPEASKIRKAELAGTVQPGEERLRGGILSTYRNIWWERVKKIRPDSSQ